jgi:hypothetical protein
MNDNVIRGIQQYSTPYDDMYLTYGTLRIQKNVDGAVVIYLKIPLNIVKKTNETLRTAGIRIKNRNRDLYNKIHKCLSVNKDSP